MAERIPGITGFDAAAPSDLAEASSAPPGAGFASPSPIGQSPATPLDGGGARIVTKVSRDWDPPSPGTTPEIVVHGRTLAEVADALNRLPEWGQGGGALRSERIAAGTSATVTVVLHANLVRRLPRWPEYSSASAAARAEWDKMFEKLRIHEQRHVDIAIEDANRLAQDLIGREIGEVADLVTEANRALQQRQDQLDADTNSGAKAGVPYGDVILDTSIQ